MTNELINLARAGSPLGALGVLATTADCSPWAFAAVYLLGVAFPVNVTRRVLEYGEDSSDTEGGA